MQDTLTNFAPPEAVQALLRRTVSPALSGRLRSAGTLTVTEIALCRSRHIPLAYDPVQIGWVTADCIDDIDVDHQLATPQKPETARSFQPRSLAPTYRFRPWSLDDLPVYRTLLDDPAVWEWMYEPYPDPLDDGLAHQLIELSGSNHHEVRAVLRDGEIVGQVRLLPAGSTGHHAELSYWVGRLHWGTGLGSAIVAVYGGQAFARDPDLKSIFAVVHPDNTASRRVLQKTGYVEEGRDPVRPGWISYRLTRARAYAINSGSDLI